MNKDYHDFVRDSLKLRTIAYFPIYKLITNSFNGGIMLSQLMYWFRKKSKIYKTREEFMMEVGFTEREYRTGRDAIAKLPFLKLDRTGSRGKRHYTLLRKEFQQFMVSFIKANPLVAEMYAEQLHSHVDFKAYYDAAGYLDNDLDDANDEFYDANVTIGDANDTINDANDIQNSQKDELDKNLDDANDTIKDANVIFTSDVSDTYHDANVTSLTESKSTYIDNKITIDVLNDNENQESSKTKPSASSINSSSEDKPQKDEKPKHEYSPEFNFVWKLYKVNASMKGAKGKAEKAFSKAMSLYKDVDIINSAITKYVESTAFEIRPAQASSFLNGICDPGHKYYLDYIKGGYTEKLEKIKVRDAIRLKDNLSKQEMFRKDLGMQGDLNTQDLLDRTSKINVMLNEKFGVEIGVFRFKERHEWIQYTGPDYIAIPIKHPMSKTDKVKVLFHIDELRQNLYVHLHGHMWNEQFENQFVDSNKGFDNIKSIEAPKKEEF